MNIEEGRTSNGYAKINLLCKTTALNLTMWGGYFTFIVNAIKNKRTTYSTLHACFFTFQSIYCRNPRSLWQPPRRVSDTPWGRLRDFS